MALYCDPHGRMDCEDCAFVKAQERGTVAERPDLFSRGAGRAPALTQQVDAEDLVAERDVLIPDEGSELDRATLVAKGTRVPQELRDRMPRRAAKQPRAGATG